MFVLACLRGCSSSAFTIYLYLLEVFFLFYRGFLLFVAFSSPLREDPLTFFRVNLILLNSSFLLVFIFPSILNDILVG